MPSPTDPRDDQTPPARPGGRGAPSPEPKALGVEDGIVGHGQFLACELAVSRALASHVALVVLTGEPGVGKSVLAQRAVERARRAKAAATAVLSTHLAPRELMRALAYGLGLDIDGRKSRMALAEAVTAFGREAAAAGARPLACVDEVENLPDASLRELLELADNNRRGPEGLQLLVCGSADLHERVTEQLGDMPLAHCQLGRIDQAEIAAYAHARLKSLSWGSPPRISPSGSQRLVEFSAGIARELNLLLTRLAMHADTNDLRVVNADDVDRVRAELTAESLLNP